MTLAVKHNKSLSVLASFGVGGVAEHFVRIRGEALPEALAWAEEQALLHHHRQQAGVQNRYRKIIYEHTF